MVFRDYRRSKRREEDWNRRKGGGRETDFRFQYQPAYEFYRDRWRGEDTQADWERQAGEEGPREDPDFRFQYEPVYELYRDRWQGGEFDRDYTFAGDSGWRNRERQGREWQSREPYGYEVYGTRRRFERSQDTGDFDREPQTPRRRGWRGAQSWGYSRPDFGTGEPWAETEVEDWQIEGPYTGYGPSGYRRSDERIREEAYERLTMNGRLDATQINVEVNNGEITLTGTVKNRWAKRMAEDTVEDILGVQDVKNHLTADQPKEEGRTPGFWGETAGMGGLLREGMDVVGWDGDFIGTVKRVRQNDFLLDRPWARDIYVPFHAVRRLYDRVELNVAADEVGAEDWPRPSIF